MQQTIQTRGQSSAGPLPGAGPDVYAPPVVQGSGQPVVHTPRRASKRNHWTWKSSGTVILLKFAVQALHDWSGLRQLECYIGVYGVALVFSYWVGERPRQSFLSWALKVIGIFLNCYVGLVSVPASLHGLLPESLAFGLPALFVTLIFYWVPPMKPGPKVMPFWQWLLFAAGAAVFWGWLGPVVVK